MEQVNKVPCIQKCSLPMTSRASQTSGTVFTFVEVRARTCIGKSGVLCYRETELQNLRVWPELA